MFQFIKLLRDLIDVAAGQRAEVNSDVYTIINRCECEYLLYSIYIMMRVFLYYQSHTKNLVEIKESAINFQ